MSNTYWYLANKLKTAIKILREEYKPRDYFRLIVLRFCILVTPYSERPFESNRGSSRESLARLREKDKAARLRFENVIITCALATPQFGV